MFIAGLCSIVYELLIASTVSYFEGDSVRYFSLTIGLYMAAMGIGSYLSKYVRRNLLERFVAIEVALGFFGGIAVPCLYLSYSFTGGFMVVYVVLTLAIGGLIGLEIPFLTRLLRDYQDLRVNIAHVLSLDYFGALLATLAFPFLLLPFLGTFRTGLVFGLINMLIAFVVIRGFPGHFGNLQRTAYIGVATMATLTIVAVLSFSKTLLAAWDSSLYSGRIIHAEQSRYQKIVLTKYKDDLRLFLDGNLQFSSSDEYRYHEVLVHAPVALAEQPPRHVLVLGAGDGLAVRELLKYPGIETITLVDLDARILDLARDHPVLQRLNGASLTRDPRVRVIAGDAQSFLERRDRLYDLVIADLPDPNNLDLTRLYSVSFYRLVLGSLAADGIFVTQATSPFFTRNAFWSIARTVNAAGFAEVVPFHVLVPSFGEWGFVAASRESLETPGHLKTAETRFLKDRQLAALFEFPPDMAEVEGTVNTLDRPTLLSLYLDGWRNWPR